MAGAPGSPIAWATLGVPLYVHFVLMVTYLVDISIVSLSSEKIKWNVFKNIIYTQKKLRKQTIFEPKLHFFFYKKNLKHNQ